jgi:hypothetical protein
MVVKLDHANRRARLSLTGDQAVERLDRHDRENPGYVPITRHGKIGIRCVLISMEAIQGRNTGWKLQHKIVQFARFHGDVLTVSLRFYFDDPH